MYKWPNPFEFSICIFHFDILAIAGKYLLSLDDLYLYLTMYLRQKYQDVTKCGCSIRIFIGVTMWIEKAREKSRDIGGMV